MLTFAEVERAEPLLTMWGLPAGSAVQYLRDQSTSAPALDGAAHTAGRVQLGDFVDWAVQNHIVTGGSWANAASSLGSTQNSGILPPSPSLGPEQVRKHSRF